MAWISPIVMNMDISRTLSEGKWENPIFQTIQKIIIYSVIPFTLIATFEVIIKNMILINLTNLGIAILNAAHRLFTSNPIKPPCSS